MESFSQFLRSAHWPSQHAWRRAVWQSFNRLGLTGTHAMPIHRRWVDIVRVPMTYPRLPSELNGLRIVQLSDLHYSPMVWNTYVTQLVDFVNKLNPDLITITGDLITGGYRYANRVAKLLSPLHARHGVLCTFGNHDYSMLGNIRVQDAKRRGDHLQRRLEDAGMIVLRNKVFRLNGLQIIGLDDAWSGRSDPQAAWANVDPHAPILVLNHDPKDAGDLLEYPWDWMLSGHTHGRQLGSTRTWRVWPGRHRRYVAGLYSMRGRHLYVNRGAAYGQRARTDCRPEITVFKLRPSTGGQSLPG